MDLKSRQLRPVFAQPDDTLRLILRGMNENGRKRRLLAIDENVDYLSVVGAVAVNLDFELRTSDDSSGLLAQLDSFDPDVLVIDLTAPRRHSGEIAVWMTGCPRPKDIVLLNGSVAEVARLANAVNDPEGLHAFHAYPKPIDVMSFGELLAG